MEPTVKFVKITCEKQFTPVLYRVHICEVFGKRDVYAPVSWTHVMMTENLNDAQHIKAAFIAIGYKEAVPE